MHNQRYKKRNLYLVLFSLLGLLTTYRINMLTATFFHIVSLLLASSTTSGQATFQKYPSGCNKDYNAARQFLLKHDAKMLYMKNKLAKAKWNYSTNLTKENKKILVCFFSATLKNFFFSKKCSQNQEIRNTILVKNSVSGIRQMPPKIMPSVLYMRKRKS